MLRICDTIRFAVSDSVAESGQAKTIASTQASTDFIFLMFFIFQLIFILHPARRQVFFLTCLFRAGNLFFSLSRMECPFLNLKLTDNAEAKDVVPGAGLAVAPIGDAAVLRVVAPTTPAIHAVRAISRPLRIRNR